MKKKYIKPDSTVCTCILECSLMTGSNTGTIPIGGTGTKPRYAPEHKDNGSILGFKGVFDEVNQDDFEEVSTDKTTSSDLW